MLFDEVRGSAVDPVHGLADDLDVSNNGILNLRVRLKGFEVRYGPKVARSLGQSLPQCVPNNLRHAPDAS
jgi:hypothetical protein